MQVLKTIKDIRYYGFIGMTVAAENALRDMLDWKVFGWRIVAFVACAGWAVTAYSFLTFKPENIKHG